MSILTNNDDELEYTAGNNTYRFYKDSQDGEDEETGDKYTEYSVVCDFKSGNAKAKYYFKKYRDDKHSRDTFFKSLTPGNDSIDFTEWEQI